MRDASAALPEGMGLCGTLSDRGLGTPSEAKSSDSRAERQAWEKAIVNKVWFKLDARRGLVGEPSAPKVLGAKHISNPDIAPY